MTGAAFFDLDKTLMQGSSGFQFARAAHEAGVLSSRQLAADGLANLRYRLHGASDAQSQALRERVAASLEGVRVRDLERLAVRILRGILPRLYPQMLTLAYEHQDAGRKVYIVTAAANDLADVLARVLTFDGGLGSHLSAVKDGVYTGRVSGNFLYGAAKAVALRELAEREGIELAESYAYSDSVSDLPMLRAVGHPVVVNPDDRLRELAQANGWQMLRFDRLRRRLLFAGGLAVAASASGATLAVLRLHTNGSRPGAALEGA